jgi:hypothetical protein
MVIGGDGGGGIRNSGSTLTLAHDVLSDNQFVGPFGGLGAGGAIYNVSGATLTVTDCRLTQNRATGHESIRVTQLAVAFAALVWQVCHAAGRHPEG